MIGTCHRLYLFVLTFLLSDARLSHSFFNVAMLAKVTQPNNLLLCSHQLELTTIFIWEFCISFDLTKLLLRNFREFLFRGYKMNSNFFLILKKSKEETNSHVVAFTACCSAKCHCLKCASTHPLGTNTNALRRKKQPK